MRVITLTTDLGYQDFYQAALKGSIISLLPTVRLVDITHEIPAFSMQHAALVLKNAYHYFPKETVHVIGIDTLVQENLRYAAMKYDGHYFVGADNGIFSILLNGEEPEALVEIELLQDLKYMHFPLADVLTKAACHLAGGKEIWDLGETLEKPVEKQILQPVYTDSYIRGHVAYIDTFGNIISNVSKELFDKVQNGRPFTLFFKRNETLNKLHWHYSEVKEGEMLCLFGISNSLEIAINKGNASKLLGLYQDETIRIEFHDEN